MKATVLQHRVPTTVWDIPSWLRKEKVLSLIGIISILVLAAVLRGANLGALGYANRYYTAAIVSMLQSWRNFFFVAAEPGGAVSIDKPPVGLWIQAISAYFFGVTGFGVLLPQILAGVLSVVVLYHLVRRWFGVEAGLIAALVLAVTPVAVAVDRNNTMDSTLILVILLAAWAFVKATESSSLRYLLLGVILIGVGFNIKMLEAYLPLPAFYGLYFLGAKERLLAKLGKLTLATGLLVAVSLSWAIVVDLTPPEERPYVGSSGNNSVVNLMLGYNGLERLNGMGGRGGLLTRLFGGSAQTPGPVVPARAPTTPGNAFPRPDGGQDGFRDGPAGGLDGTPGGIRGGAPGGQGGGPGGFMGTGQAGLWRLFVPPLSKEASWLLPFAILCALLLIISSRPSWPISRPHQAVVLWGGWLLTGGTFFSVAGFFHEYYLAILAPPLASLAGIGFLTIWRLGSRHRNLAIPLFIVAAGGAIVFQYYTAQSFVREIWWWPGVGGLLFAGAVFLVWTVWRSSRPLAIAGASCLLAAMLVTPAIWSGLTMLNSSDNQSLPSAYDGRSSGPANRGGLQVDQALLDYLQANTKDVQYLMAVPSSMQGSDYIIATGRPVLYLGGFMGQDRVASVQDLVAMVANAELRYVYYSSNGGGGGRGGPGGLQGDVSTWISASCVPVQGFETQTQNLGAPDGIGPARPGAGNTGPGGMQVSLYDCSGVTIQPSNPG
jgi:4-amino-4-deoxy-L-arabinose transferase-like glycosyltransferase